MSMIAANRHDVHIRGTSQHSTLQRAKYAAPAQRHQLRGSARWSVVPCEAAANSESATKRRTHVRKKTSNTVTRSQREPHEVTEALCESCKPVNNDEDASSVMLSILARSTCGAAPNRFKLSSSD